jgi:hypothetical protein
MLVLSIQSPSVLNSGFFLRSEMHASVFTSTPRVNGLRFLSLGGKEAWNGEGEWCGFGYVALRSRIMSESIDLSFIYARCDLRAITALVKFCTSFVTAYKPAIRRCTQQERGREILYQEPVLNGNIS